MHPAARFQALELTSAANDTAAQMAQWTSVLPKHETESQSIPINHGPLWACADCHVASHPVQIQNAMINMHTA